MLFSNYWQINKKIADSLKIIITFEKKKKSKEKNYILVN